MELKENDRVIVFNCIEWNKTGDLPEGNNKYYQSATILNIRVTKYNEQIADVIFDSGLVSNGHFVNNIETINQWN